MKKQIGSNLLFALALGALLYTIAANPPGGGRWVVFIDEPSPLLAKAKYIAASYVWPAILSFCAIALFQLQFRLVASDANKRVIFSICTMASGAMLLGLRAISFVPNAGPSYVIGMALGYTVMSRLYAVRMRKVFREVQLPWPVWKGDPAARQEIDRIMRARMAGPR